MGLGPLGEFIHIKGQYWGVISSIGQVSDIRGEIFKKGVGFIGAMGNSVWFLYDDWAREGNSTSC